MFILLVFIYFVVKYDVSIVEKLVLLLLIGAASLAPIAWPEGRVVCAVAQGLLGVYIVLRMHYLRASEKRGVIWK
jgi:hypothetical protein